MEDLTYSTATWFNAIAGAMAVGSIGLLPRFIVPNEQTQKEKPFLEFLLSIAVGSQLGDVFLHLLPEAYSHPDGSTIRIGLWTLFGLFLFFLIEQIFPEDDQQNESENETKQVRLICFYRFNRRKQEKNSIESKKDNSIKTTGYLNLFANFIDNLTHGAAIGGGFAVNSLVGLTTLIGIIIHEIPHEMGDFAILLRSGFDRQQATKAQLITSLGGILGAILALYYSNTIHSTLWVLPFTSGGFLYVALVKTVPDLLKENHFKNSFRQFIGVIGGLLIIYSVVTFVG